MSPLAPREMIRLPLDWSHAEQTAPDRLTRFELQRHADHVMP